MLAAMGAALRRRDGEDDMKDLGVWPARGAADHTRDRILEMREMFCMTQTEFADYLGVSRGTVASWEGGLTGPGTRSARRALDRAMLRMPKLQDLKKQMMKLFDEADIVVGHNGKAFDVDTMKGRALKWGLPPSTSGWLRTYSTACPREIC